MRGLATLPATVLLLALLLAGCAGGNPGGTGETADSFSETSGGNSTTPAAERTQSGGSTSGLQVEQISSGSEGLGQQQIVVAPSAEALSEATDIQVPDSGGGTYLAVFWGEKQTGGYEVEVSSARTEGDQVILALALREPPPDAMVSQALTYPYAAAVVPEGIPADAELVPITQGGRELDWPVRRV